MNLRKLFTRLVVLVMLGLAVVLAGCNTWHGAGKDVEHLGQKMEGSDSK